MVVEAEQVDAAAGDVVERLRQGFEVVHLEAAMHAEVGAGGGARRIERRQQRSPHRQRAEPRFPGQGHAEIGGGDAGGEELGGGVPHRDLRAEADAGAGLQRALMRIAMDIDEAGKDEEAGRIQPLRPGRGGGGDPGRAEVQRAGGEARLAEDRPAGQAPAHLSSPPRSACARRHSRHC